MPKLHQKMHKTTAVALDVRVTLAPNVTPHEFIQLLRTFLNEGNSRVVEYIGENRATVSLLSKITSTVYDKPHAG